MTTPELCYLLELADLFEISLDALLGYQYRNNDREHTLEQLKALRHSPAPDPLAQAETALKKYPNDFQIVKGCAELYQICGMERHEEVLLRKALALLEQACQMIDQNRDDRISLSSLHMEMATIYFELEETDRALTLLKGDNPCGINNARIGNALSLIPSRTEEALPYLSKALLDCIVQQVTLVNGYLNVLARQADWQASRELIHWLLDTFAVFRRSDTHSFLDKTEAALLAQDGALSLQLGKPEEARSALRRAYALASAFDERPDYDAASVRFSVLDRQYMGYDNLGTTACEAVQMLVQEAQDPVLTALWKEVRHGS